MINIDEFWTPNEQTGFISRIPAGVIDTLPENISQLMREKPWAMKDEDLIRIAKEPLRETFDPGSLYAEQYEGALRLYAFLVANLKNRQGVYERLGNAIPERIAEPFLSLTEHHKRPDGLTYASYVLCNYTGQITGFTNADELADKIPSCPSETDDERWFIAAHLAV